MAQSDEKDVATPYEYSAGLWEWDDTESGGWIKFDEMTSNQIESALKSKIDGGSASFEGAIQVALSKGPFFGNATNKEVYVVSINLSWNGDHPVVDGANQKNTKTGYRRGVRRVPGLDRPVSEDEQKQVVCCASL